MKIHCGLYYWGTVSSKDVFIPIEMPFIPQIGDKILLSDNKLEEMAKKIISNTKMTIDKLMKYIDVNELVQYLKKYNCVETRIFNEKTKDIYVRLINTESMDEKRHDIHNTIDEKINMMLSLIAKNESNIVQHFVMHPKIIAWLNARSIKNNNDLLRCLATKFRKETEKGGDTAIMRSLFGYLVGEKVISQDEYEKYVEEMGVIEMNRKKNVIQSKRAIKMRIAKGSELKNMIKGTK